MDSCHPPPSRRGGGQEILNIVIQQWKLILLAICLLRWKQRAPKLQHVQVRSQAEACLARVPRTMFRISCHPPPSPGGGGGAGVHGFPLVSWSLGQSWAN